MIASTFSFFQAGQNAGGFPPTFHLLLKLLLLLLAGTPTSSNGLCICFTFVLILFISEQKDGVIQ